jgi:hypothetical protein
MEPGAPFHGANGCFRNAPSGRYLKHPLQTIELKKDSYFQTLSDTLLQFNLRKRAEIRH